MAATEPAVPLSSRFERWRTGLVAESTAMSDLFATAERVAPTSLSVLLQGETGTGKEIVARLIHGASGRRGRLVAFNCAAVPTSLAESELFGHVRGAFTGAEVARPGLFRLADRGTLLLDEVAELDLGIQVKLLRVVEDGVVRPVGGSGSSHVDVRLVAATHRDLALLVDHGQFREDLFQRLAGVCLTVAPLRERPEDITPLVHRFLVEAAPDRQPRIEGNAWKWLRMRSWPGNVRELRQTVHRAVALGGERLTIEDFTRLEPRRLGVARPIDDWLTGKSWQEIEAEVVRWAIKRHRSVRQAARALQRPPSTLADRAQRLGIEAPRQRPGRNGSGGGGQ